VMDDIHARFFAQERRIVSRGCTPPPATHQAVWSAGKKALDIRTSCVRRIPFDRQAHFYQPFRSPILSVTDTVKTLHVH